MRKLFGLFFLLLAATFASNAKNGKHPPQIPKSPPVVTNMKFIPQQALPAKAMAISPQHKVPWQNTAGVSSSGGTITKNLAYGNEPPGTYANVITINNISMAALHTNEYLPPQKQSQNYFNSSPPKQQYQTNGSSPGLTKLPEKGMIATTGITHGSINGDKATADIPIPITYNDAIVSTSLNLLTNICRNNNYS